MTALGTSLIVLGLAFLCSGLVFLVPTFWVQGGRRVREAFDEGEDGVPFYVQRRQDRSAESRDKPQAPSVYVK